MELFFVVLACLIVAAASRGKGGLYNFDSKATVPLRGLLAIGIVLHHLSLNYEFDECIGGVNISPIYYFREMGGPIVAVFFLITGFGLSKSLQNKGSAYLSGFMKKRLGKIIPEFLILTTIMLAVSDMYGVVTFSEAMDKMAKGFPPLPFSWFIYAIVYVYSAFFVSALIARSDCKLTGVILLLMIVLYSSVMMALGWGGWWYLTVPAVPLGYFVALYEKKITEFLSQAYMPWCIGAFAFIFVFLLGRIPGSRIMAALLFAILIYVCMRLYRIKPFPALMLLGDVSLYIYLVHGAILQAVKGFESDKYISTLIVVLASIAIAMIIKGIRGFVESRDFRVYSKNRA